MKKSMLLFVMICLLVPLCQAWSAVPLHGTGDAKDASVIEAMDLMKQAHDMEPNGGYKDAVPIWKKAVALHPRLYADYPEDKMRLHAMSGLANAYFYSGDYKNALPTFELAQRYIEEFDKSGESILPWYIAECKRKLAEEGKPGKQPTSDEQAKLMLKDALDSLDTTKDYLPFIERLKDIVAYDPRFEADYPEEKMHIQAMAALGRSYYQIGDWTNALITLKIAQGFFEEKDKSGESILPQLIADCRKHLAEEAKSKSKPTGSAKAHSLNAESARRLLRRGFDLREQGKYTEAISALKRVVAFDPRFEADFPKERIHLQAEWELASTYYAHKDWAKALPLLEQFEKHAREKYPDADLLSPAVIAECRKHLAEQGKLKSKPMATKSGR